MDSKLFKIVCLQLTFKQVFSTLDTLFFCCSRVPLADFHDAKHTTRSMHLDLTKGRLLTCGGDRIVKVNDLLIRS